MLGERVALGAGVGDIVGAVVAPDCSMCVADRWFGERWRHGKTRGSASAARVGPAQTQRTASYTGHAYTRQVPRTICAEVSKLVQSK